MALVLGIAAAATEIVPAVEAALPVIGTVATNVLTFLGVSSLIDDVGKLVSKPTEAAPKALLTGSADAGLPMIDIDDFGELEKIGKQLKQGKRKVLKPHMKLTHNFNGSGHM